MKYHPVIRVKLLTVNEQSLVTIPTPQIIRIIYPKISWNSVCQFLSTVKKINLECNEDEHNVLSENKLNRTE